MTRDSVTRDSESGAGSDSTPVSAARPGLSRRSRWSRVRLHIDFGSRRGITLFYAVVCGGILVLALSQLSHGLKVGLLWPRAEGEITGIEYRGSGRLSRPYAQFRFSAPDGRIVQTGTPDPSAFHPGKAGDRVVVAHHPRYAERADLVHTGHLYGTAMLQLLLALLFGWLTCRSFDGAFHVAIPADDSELPADTPNL